MFHYRWHRVVDREACSRWLAFDALGPVGRDRISESAALFTNRQVGRMALVGCSAENRPVLEGSYLRLLSILEELVPNRAFLFGDRPCRADFGLYGQLKQLASDPTPASVMRQRTPFTYRWLEQLDDASGREGDWLTFDDTLPSGVEALLAMIGELYLPFLLANHTAFHQGHEEVALQLDGHRYAQPVFKFQVKCLAELRTAFAALDHKTRVRVVRWLAPVGGAEILAGD